MSIERNTKMREIYHKWLNTKQTKSRTLKPKYSFSHGSEKTKAAKTILRR
jgi:hypothetical protein